MTFVAMMQMLTCLTKMVPVVIIIPKNNKHAFIATVSPFSMHEVKILNVN